MNWKELKQLYRMGFALHWLRPNSKVPVKGGWTSGPRFKWDEFKAQYRKGYNVGVRLGAASKVDGGYLAAVDLDLKSSSKADRKEAYKALCQLFPEVRGNPFRVKSGRRNGSAHFYFVTPEPIRVDSRKASSSKTVKLEMPGVPPSAKEKEILSPEELTRGVRLRKAWEVSILSEGRQIALPGSTHPDTGKPYVWFQGFPGPSLPPALGMGESSPSRADSAASNAPSREETRKFVAVDLESLGLREDQVAAIRDGKGVEDRSAECFALTMALLSRGVGEHLITSLFTDRKLYLGETAFDHAKTDSRSRAALWFEKYCLRKAREKVKQTSFEFEANPVEVALTGEPWERRLDRTADKERKLRATFKNVLIILENRVSGDFLQRNAFANEDVFTEETPWGSYPGKKRSGNTDDALAVKEWLISEYRLEVPVNTIDEVLNRIAAKNTFHPVKDLLESLEWDGVERIPTAFAEYLNAKMPEPYLTAVSTKFFLAMIARIYEPGCKFDHLPVFEGPQGIGKSSFGRILVGDEWFLDGLPDLADKDAALNLQGIWLCEMSELSSLYRSQLETAKGFIARQTDKVRPPYGARRVDYPRSCVFYGTTNKRDYLTDETGNRRFWPVAVKGCKFKALKRDRFQLLAEAFLLYQHFPEPLYLNEELSAKQAKAIQESRRIDSEADAMEAKFLDWLKLPKKDRSLPSVEEVTLEDLFDNGPFVTFQKNHGNRVSAALVLRKAGYRKIHTNRGNRWRAN